MNLTGMPIGATLVRELMLKAFLTLTVKTSSSAIVMFKAMFRPPGLAFIVRPTLTMTYWTSVFAWYLCAALITLCGGRRPSPLPRP